MEPVKRPPSKGRGRGLLALTSYEPVPRPSKALAESHLKPIVKTLPQTYVLNGHMKGSKDNSVERINGTLLMNNGVLSQNGMSKDIRSNISSKQMNSIVHNHQNAGPRVVAKYNFQGNPDQPGGFKELAIKQGEYLTLLQKGHLPSNNPLWWEVENVNGDVGFVPANYCMEHENKPTNLPWLENKRLEEEKAAEEKQILKQKERENTIKNSKFGVPEDFLSKPVVKAYQSAYSENQTTTAGGGGTRKFYCEVCDKQLNGPTPYNMHMASKAHREEVEYLKSCS